MKRYLIPLLIFVLLLAACQPVEPASDMVVTQAPADDEVTLVEQPGQQTHDTPADESDGTTSLSSAMSDDDEPTGPVPRPDVVWDTDPNAVILRGTFCCGFTTMLVPMNYIPDFQIWGDGRIVWTEMPGDKGRQVLEGQLSASELADVLQQMVDEGFFGWEDYYANYNVSDFADQCITINLQGASKSVCEYYEGAPDAFHKLYEMLAQGAGAQGADYLPEKSYLTAYPTQVDQMPTELVLMTWDAALTGFSLADAVDSGQWLSGDLLAQTWEIVNANPWGGKYVVEDGKYYEISVQLPGLSMTEPPAK